MPELITPPEPGLYLAYDTWFLRSSHRLIRRLKKHFAPSVHGTKTWGAAFILMDYLSSHRPRRGTRIMDVGCGWGPASVYCAHRFRAEVTAVDRDPEVFPFLETLAALNGVELGERLTFQQAEFGKIDSHLLAAQQLLIGSDICFWDELVAPLARMVARGLRQGIEEVLISDPGRQPFFDLADRLGRRFHTELIPWYAVEPRRIEGTVLRVWA